MVDLDKVSNNNNPVVSSVDLNDFVEVVDLDQNTEKIMNEPEVADFCQTVKDAIDQELGGGRNLNWNKIYTKISGIYGAIMVNNGEPTILDFYNIDSGESLKNTYTYFLVLDYIQRKRIDPHGNYDQRDKEIFFMNFEVEKRKDSFLFSQNFMGFNLDSFDNMRAFVFAYEYQRKMPLLPNKVLNSKHLGFISAALLQEELFDKKTLNIIYNDDAYAMALYATFQLNPNTKVLMDNFDIRDINKFRRIFFPVPLEIENLFIDQATAAYDWSKFDDIATAFDDQDGFLTGQNDWLTDIGKDLFVFDGADGLIDGFSVEEQETAFNKLMQISNIHKTDEVSLEKRRKAFVEILYWEKVLKNVGVPEDQILPLSMVALRNDMIDDDAQIVPGYSNLFYVPDISLFYRAILDAYISGKVWGNGDNTPGIFSFLATAAHETNIKNVNGDHNSGGSKGPVQMNKITVYDLQNRSYFKNYFKLMFPSNIADADYNNFVFSAPANTRSASYFALDYLKGYNQGKGQWKSKWQIYRNYNGNITQAMIDSMDPKILQAKQNYPNLVLARETAYKYFAQNSRQQEDKFVQSYNSIIENIDRNQVKNPIQYPAYKPVFGAAYLSFLQKFFAGRDRFEINIQEGNQVFQKSTKIILNPDEDQTIDDLIFADRSLADNFNQHQNQVMKKPVVADMGGGSFQIRLDMRSFRSSSSLDNLDVDGDIFMKYKAGDPSLRNTLYQYLRGNLEEGIAYHNSLWKPGDPFYKLVPFQAADGWKTGVKVYISPTDADADTQGVAGTWDWDWIKDNGFLKLYLDPSKDLNWYNLGQHGLAGVDLFVDRDFDGTLLTHSHWQNPDLTDISALSNLKLNIAPNDPSEIMFLGASLVQGLSVYAGNYTKRIHNGVQTLNSSNFPTTDNKSASWGVPGETIKTGVNKLKNNIETIADAGVKYIFFSYISNDARNGIVGDDFKNYAEEIVELCNDHGITAIFFDPFAGPEMEMDLAQKIWDNSDALNDLQKTRRDFYIISYQDLLGETIMKDPNSFWDGKLHFEAKYYPEMMEALFNSLFGN